MTENIQYNEELTCKPLDTYEEIIEFLQDPPPWRTLCTEIKPHSDQAIRNMDINKNFGETFLETPQTFCHYNNTEAEDRIIKRQDYKKLPKTLVCHDMANGYHDDSIIDGTSNYEAYTFYNWGGIDIFCYFSHHLVTIPPLGWINVGHAHGVKVIGTLITEWSEGAAFWEKVLESEVSMQNFASALVAIAKTLKFDGWLLNVENKITKPKQLLDFVRLLHSVLHQELTDPVLIWYDSVTVDGHLNWQNCLNEKNRAFFDACDGIFTNYSWSEGDVLASSSAAGSRVTDVYVGIDVWGRNFYGGGQFNTQEAVKVAAAYGCSLAVFAPAWTHEALSDESCDVHVAAGRCSRHAQFQLRERALWGSLWPHLATKLPAALPFATSFCRGLGRRRWLYGEVISPGPWYNLRHMQYQPNSSHGPHGYLLSVLENIIAASRHGYLKDKAAIVHCRRSLELSRIELSTKDTKETNTDEKSDIFTLVDDNKIAEDGADAAEVEKVDKENQVDQEQVEQKSPKPSRKVTDVFRNLFRIKTTRDTEDEPEEIPESSLNQSRKSMIQPSLNLRLGQNSHKIRLALAPVPDELECLEPFYEDSFIGGSCLKVNPSDKIDSRHRLARIFHSDFYFDTAIIACVVTKNLPNAMHQFLNIELRATDTKHRVMKIVLVGRDVPSEQSNNAADSATLYAYPINSSADAEFRDIQKYMLLHEPGFYVPVENPFGWKVRYYVVPATRLRVVSVDCRTGLVDGPILLGHFGLCRRPYRTDT